MAEAADLHLVFIGIMVMGMIILWRVKDKAQDISNGYNKLWKVFEILLFVLVGASVDLSYLQSNGWMALLVLLIGLGFRSVGVIVCVLGQNLPGKKDFLLCYLIFLRLQFRPLLAELPPHLVYLVVIRF